MKSLSISSKFEEKILYRLHLSRKFLYLFVRPMIHLENSKTLRNILSVHLQNVVRSIPREIIEKLYKQIIVHQRLVVSNLVIALSIGFFEKRKKGTICRFFAVSDYSISSAAAKIYVYRTGKTVQRTLVRMFFELGVVNIVVNFFVFDFAAAVNSTSNYGRFFITFSILLNIFE